MEEEEKEITPEDLPSEDEDLEGTDETDGEPKADEA